MSTATPDAAFLVAADLLRDQPDDQYSLGPMQLVQESPNAYSVLHRSDEDILITTDIIQPQRFPSARHLASHLLTLENVADLEDGADAPETMHIPMNEHAPE